MSIPSQQHALAILTKKGAWGLIPAGVEQPGPGEILVRVESTALNPIDWKVQATEYSNYMQEYPAILGSDSAGVVVAVGEGVDNLAVGDRVFHQGFFTNRLATFKQYAVIGADIAAKIPDNLTFDEAATIPLGLATAAIGLYNETWERGGANLVAPWSEGGRGKYARQPIVVFGGSSSVGQFVLQSAKLSGFSPIITTVSPRNNDFVKSLGATHTIDRSLSAEEIQSTIKKITSDPVKIVYDAISIESTQTVAYDVLSPGGILIIVLNPLIPKEKLTSDKKVINTYGTVHAELNRKFGQGLYSNLTNLFKSGDYKPNPVEALPGGLTGIIEGLERLQNDKVSGRKLVAHPQETVTLK
ncbi:GroES-like protein [Cristinia sonorae]|uniref:GroES-like protein n=1 Tax=Cristinia sonorae TaxID=1940300 RepID=A0A8K0URG9_9AGAR|nr:GroES-like protein [Cristinia sonorae]